jgi:hypothetical protein
MNPAIFSGLLRGLLLGKLPAMTDRAYLVA